MNIICVMSAHEAGVRGGGVGGGREEGPVQMNNRVGNVCAYNTAKLQGQ